VVLLGNRSADAFGDGISKSRRSGGRQPYLYWRSYKLKQLIDLIAQRNYLFAYDGKQYSPLLHVEKAIVVYTRGSRFLEGTPKPPSRFDHQATYLGFWLRLVGDAMCGRKHMEDEPSAECTRACVAHRSKFALVVGDKIYPRSGLKLALQSGDISRI
jgi:Flavodoxin-like fold